MQIEEFLKPFNTLAAIYSKSMSDEMIETYFDLFEPYDGIEFANACRQHAKSGRFFPVPADLFAFMPTSQKNKHVDAEEAWAICIDSFDEYATVVLTPQILEAKIIAQDIWDSGDKVAARMAFKSAYERIIKTAPEPKWSVSLGYDPVMREVAVKKAQELGRLPKPEDTLMIEHDDEITIQQLVNKAKKEGYKPNPILMKRLHRIVDEKNDPDMEFAIDALYREKKRDKFEQHRQEELDRLDKKINGIDK